MALRKTYRLCFTPKRKTSIFGHNLKNSLQMPDNKITVYLEDVMLFAAHAELLDLTSTSLMAFAAAALFLFLGFISRLVLKRLALSGNSNFSNSLGIKSDCPFCKSDLDSAIDSEHKQNRSRAVVIVKCASCQKSSEWSLQNAAPILIRKVGTR